MKRITMLATACTAVLGCVVANPVSAASQEASIHVVYQDAAAVRDLIVVAGRDSKAFRSGYEHRFDRVWHPDWRRSNDQRAAIQKMDEALEVVTRRNRNGERPKYLRDDVVRCIDRAREVDRLASESYDTLSDMRGPWVDLRKTLNDLAEAYDIPDIR